MAAAKRERSTGPKLAQTAALLGTGSMIASLQSSTMARPEKMILLRCSTNCWISHDGEDCRKDLKTDLPPETRKVIDRQLQYVQRNHDQIKALRDALSPSA
jgi:hypothetical protein